MRDPDECISAHGTIVTGVGRDRVPPIFEPVLAAAADELVVLGVPHTAAVSAASEVDGWGLCVYGSVATGWARVGASISLCSSPKI